MRRDRSGHPFCAPTCPKSEVAEKLPFVMNCFAFLSQIFRSKAPPEGIDLISKLLQYTPDKRTTPLQSCGHSFFDELRDPNTKLPNTRPLPPLFDFTAEEMRAGGELMRKLIPPHAQGAQGA